MRPSLACRFWIMQSIGAVICVVLSAATGAAPATAPATIPATQPSSIQSTHPNALELSPAVQQKLLADLASDTWAVRQRAQENIVQLGPAALPMVEAALAKENDAEVRGALMTARDRINRDRILGPSYITIHLKNASPKDVFEQLNRQCFADLKVFPENLWEQQKWPAVTVDIEHEPFWKALNLIAASTGVTLNHYGEGLRLMRGAGFSAMGPSMVEGPFLVLATRINRSQSVALANNSVRSDFSIQLAIYAEPKLKVLEASSVSLSQAMDDRGNSLLPDVSQTRSVYGVGNNAWNMTAPMRYPAHPGTHIAHLKGEANFIVATASQQLEIPNILSAHDETRTIGGLSITLHEVKKNVNGYEVNISTSHQAAGGQWESMQQSIYRQMKIYDAAGQAFEYRGMSSRTSNTGSEMTLTLAPLPSPDGHESKAPSKLVWEIPTSTTPVSVPFEFANLAMP